MLTNNGGSVKRIQGKE